MITTSSLTRALVASASSALLVACGATTERPQSAQPATVDAEMAAVTETDWMSTYEAGGVVAARNTAVIASRIVATVTDVRVRAGARVRKGQTLVRLDGRELGARAEAARASAAGARLALEAAAADAKAAEAALTLARATHDRVKGLFDKKSATAQELDQASAALSEAEARVAGARARVAESDAGVRAARAGEDAASVGESYTDLVAPFDGLVVSRHVDPGSLASPGLPLVTLDDTSEYHIEARMDDARARLVALGGRAEAQFDAPGRAPAWMPVMITEIATVDPATHTFVVKAALPAGADARSGRFARLRVAGASRRAITAPASAIVLRGQIAYAFAVNEQGAARLRMVSVGSTAGGRIEVLAGLEPGERVVVQPPASLTDGTIVRGGSSGAGR